jgi:hypothetical protein
MQGPLIPEFMANPTESSSSDISRAWQTVLYISIFLEVPDRFIAIFSVACISLVADAIM